MINRIKSLFAAPQDKMAPGLSPNTLQLAAAALLVEAARMDDAYDQVEREAVASALEERFGLSDEECETLLHEAENAQHDATDLHRFTRTINEAYSHDDRLQVMEMLWRVMYADGKLHAYEANLARRLGGLLHITDRDRGEARKRALARTSAETA